jgi:hypothetical protein
MLMPAPEMFKTSRYFAAPRPWAARYPSRTSNHNCAGKSPNACQTCRPGSSRNNRQRTSALPPYCRIVSSIWRGQFRLEECVSDWGVVTGSSAHYAAPRPTLQDRECGPVSILHRGPSGMLPRYIADFCYGIVARASCTGGANISSRRFAPVSAIAVSINIMGSIGCR